MDSQLPIANLNVDNGHFPSIRFQSLTWQPYGMANKHEILGFHTVGEGSTTTLPTEYQKTHTKGKRCGAKFVHLLNGYEGRSNKKGSDLAIFLQDRALVGGPPSEGHARTIEGLSSFQEFEFRFPTTTSHPNQHFMKSTQYLHVTAPTLKHEETLFHGSASCGYDHVEVFSGVCLFSMKTLNSSFAENGRQNLHKLTHSKPTLYEMDYVIRASTAIADVASIIALENRHHVPTTPGVTVGITLDVPSFHYYYTVAQKLEEDLCTPTEALKWLEAIEQRRDDICRFFQNAVWIALKKRGVEQGECGVKFSLKDNAACSYIRRSLQEGAIPQFQITLEHLKDENNDVWNDFYDLLPEKDRPQDFRALGYLFHVFAVMRYAIQGQIPTSQRKPDPSSHIRKPTTAYQSCMERRPRRLLISVDDWVERKIYTRCQTMLKTIRKRPHVSVLSNLVELYMCRRIFVNNNESGGDLYQHDPAPTVPRVVLHGCEKNGNVEFFTHAKMGHEEILQHLYESNFVPFLGNSRVVPRRDRLV